MLNSNKINKSNNIIYIEHKNYDNYSDTNFIERQLDLFSSDLKCSIQWTSSKQVIELFKYLDICPKEISKTTKKEQKTAAFIFIATLFFVYLVYSTFDKWTNWVAYVDTLTTAIFFVGMWLMAKRKIENWVFWIVGDIISVPLYFYKGFTFTSFQYFGFTFIAIFGYIAWKKSLYKNPITL